MRLGLGDCTLKKSHALAFAALFLAALGWRSAPAVAQVLIKPSGPVISLDVGKGVLISLDRDADTVFVANPAVADVQIKSPRIIYLFGKDPGATSVYAVDAQQQVMLSRPVAVRRDIESLQAALIGLNPTGSLRVSAVDKSLILTGEVRSPVEAEEVQHLASGFVTEEKQLVNRVTVDGPNQINLRVRIAEVSRTVSKVLGINWESVGRAGNLALGVATGNPVLGVVGSSTSGGTVTSNYVPSVLAGGLGGAAYLTRNTSSGGTTDSILLGFNAGNTNVNAVIDALSSNGLVKILAEPNLTAMTGETASFLAGGEFPIVVPGALGQVNVEFKSYGVSLAFTPVVLTNGRISLRVRPEVSEISTQGEVEISGTTIPALSTRRVETTVELGSGESFAIGGLIQNSTTDALSKLPGLGDLPVIGSLFRSSQFQRNESELVIVVTPYLVRPVSAARLALPTDGFTAPTDADLVVRGVDEHATAPVGGRMPSGPGGNGLIGAGGFILN
jgi:pilus assembly protein CpaC